MPAGAAAIYAFTPQGLAVGLGLAPALGGTLFAPLSLRSGRLGTGKVTATGEEAVAGGGVADYDVHTDFGRYGGEELETVWFNSLPEVLGKIFFQYGLHIFIGATGIAVRSIAPLLCSKDTDPAVLVVDQRARFVISLLSGHLGGANTWAYIVADLLGATPVITTATDAEGLPAMELLAREKGLALSDVTSLEGVKSVSAALLAGRTVRLYDPDDWLGLAESPFFVPAESPEEAGRVIVSGRKEHCASVIVTEREPVSGGFTAQYSAVEEDEGQAPLPSSTPLVLHPPVLFIGIGCRLGISSAAILRALHDVHAKAGLSLAALVAFASVDAKEREAGLLEAARQLGMPLYFYSTDTLGALPVTKPSANVLERFGIPGICEPAALAAAMGLKEHSCILPENREASRISLSSGSSSLDPPPEDVSLPEGGSPDEARTSVETRAPMFTQPEDAFARSAYAADLLFPKYALNGVTVAVAIRRKA